MNSLIVLTRTELKLLQRDATAIFVVLALPLGLLLIFGSMVASGAPSGPIDAPRMNQAYFAAMAVTLSLAMLGMFTIPTYLGTYREKGILRRLATTPVPPWALLVAQIAVHTLLALLGLALVIGIGRAVLGVDLPSNLPGLIISFVLGAAALYAIGMLIAAIAPSGRAAGAIGPLLLFPLLFLAGAWLPKERMPEPLARVADLTPLSAAMESIQAAWEGRAPEPLHLAMLLLCALVFGALAARAFRWE